MKPSPIDLPLTSTHWGTFTPTGPIDAAGAPTSLAPWPGDPSPNPAIAASTWQGYRSDKRIQRPAIREGWLKSRNDPDSRQARGLEPFIDVPWDEALDMVAESLGNTIATRGNETVFGGSYGWASAGRFHHAQSQVHRFLKEPDSVTSDPSLEWIRLLPHSDTAVMLALATEIILAGRHDPAFQAIGG